MYITTNRALDINLGPTQMCRTNQGSGQGNPQCITRLRHWQPQRGFHLVSAAVVVNYPRSEIVSIKSKLFSPKGYFPALSVFHMASLKLCFWRMKITDVTPQFPPI
jgi:hypothetical protein